MVNSMNMGGKLTRVDNLACLFMQLLHIGLMDLALIGQGLGGGSISVSIGFMTLLKALAHFISLHVCLRS